MNRIGELLGSRTRGNIVEALALSDKPMTAYRVAKKYNMNVAKVYKEFKRLDGLGLLKSESDGAKVYELADDDLKSLALKLSSRVQTYESWKSKEARRTRFRMGLSKVPRFELEIPPGGGEQGARRMPGELENLAALGRKKFDRKYRRTAERAYARV